MWIYEQPWSSIIKIVVVLIITYVLIKIFSKIFNKSMQRHIKRGNARISTLMALLRSAVVYIIAFIGGMVILQTVGVSVAPILASAGIVSIAVGFGAQSLIKDIISGFFILFENCYAVGDYIQVGSISGFCEELGLRTTKLRDWGGELHVIPNGQVAQLTNFSRGNLNTNVDIPVPYNEDLPRVLRVIEQALVKLRESGLSFIGGPAISGVDKLEDTRVIIRLNFTSTLYDRSSLSRKIRQACKEEFDAAGIIASPVLLQLLNADRGQ